MTTPTTVNRIQDNMMLCGVIIFKIYTSVLDISGYFAESNYTLVQCNKKFLDKYNHV